MVPDITENLFQAIDVLVDKKIEAVKFDETIKATVVDDSESEKGKYTVSTGSTKFVAYSSETQYRKDDLVLVTIPQGNYDNQKIIISKYTTSTTTPLHYTAPFNKIIDLTSNLIVGNTKIAEFWANGNLYRWSSNLTSFVPFNTSGDSVLEGWHSNVIKTNTSERDTIFEAGFTAIGVKAWFSTWLNEYNTISGNYGLAVQITFQQATNQSFTKIFTFDSDAFFGDIYNFETYILQEQIFDISEFKDYPITGIQLFPYQRDNFYQLDGQKVPTNDMDDFGTVIPNIFIKDPYVCLGVFADSFKDDLATLLTESSLTYYKYPIPTEADPNSRNIANKKIISLQWIHKDEKTGIIKVVQPSVEGDSVTFHEFVNDYEIRWYRHKIGASSPDAFAGAHWQRFYGLNAEADEEGEWVRTSGLDNATDKITIEFQPNVNLANEQLKAIILKRDGENGEVHSVVAETGILTFTNDNEVSSKPTLIDANALSIRFDDTEKGHYFLYNEAGDVGKNEDTEIRCLTAVFSDTETNVYDKPVLNANDCSSIIWTFPDSNDGPTMIVPMTSPDPDGEPATPSYFNNYHQSSVGFTIKPHLNHTATNNTIKLDIIKDGVNYSAQVNPIFGTAGTNGSDYTVILNWRDGKNALNLSKKTNGTFIDGQLIGDVMIYDQAGDPIDWPSGCKLTASWEVAWHNGSSGEAIREYGDYPMIATSNKIVNIDYCFSSSDGENTYIYNSTTNSFEIYNGNDKQLYRYGEKPKIEFRPVQVEEPVLYIDENNNNTLTWGYPNGNNQYENVSTVTNIERNENGVIKYYYSTLKRYFVEYNGIYILDPWNEYDETETYYLPVQGSGKQYIDTGYIRLSPTSAVEDHVVTITATNNTSIDDLYILKLVISDFGDYDLITYYPIPLKLGEKLDNLDQQLIAVDYIEGPDRVRYGSSGETAYNKNPYQITARYFDNNNFVKYRCGYYNSNNEISDGQWHIIQAGNEVENFAPKLEETAQNVTLATNYYKRPMLYPPSVYIPEAGPYGVQFEGTINDNIIKWTQPILVYQNKYPSRTLNKWNGKEILQNDDEGTIVANGFAAGKKESDNTFSGVMLGDWSRSVADEVITKQTGIYGFNHGAMSYAFKDDGTGFIGKDGSGRIYFNGQSSQIYSNQWRGNNHQGMLLDIDDGYIKMQDNKNISIFEFFTNANILRDKFINGNRILSGLPGSYTYPDDGIRYFYQKKLITLNSNTYARIYKYKANQGIIILLKSKRISFQNFSSGVSRYRTFLNTLNARVTDPSYLNNTVVGWVSPGEDDYTYRDLIDDYFYLLFDELADNECLAGGNTIYYQFHYDNGGYIDNMIFIDSHNLYNLAESLPIIGRTVYGYSRDNEEDKIYRSKYDIVYIIDKEFSDDSYEELGPFDYLENDIETINYINENGEVEYTVNNIDEAITPEEFYYKKTYSSKYINLSAKESQLPLSIGTNRLLEQRNFKVNWAGTASLKNATFMGRIKSGSVFSSNIDTIKLKVQNKANITDWVFYDGVLISPDGNTILKAIKDNDDYGIRTRGMCISDFDNTMTAKLGFVQGMTTYWVPDSGNIAGHAETAATHNLGLSSKTTLIIHSTENNAALRAKKSLYLEGGYSVNSNNQVTKKATIELRTTVDDNEDGYIRIKADKDIAIESKDPNQTSSQRAWYDVEGHSSRISISAYTAINLQVPATLYALDGNNNWTRTRVSNAQIKLTNYNNSDKGKIMLSANQIDITSPNYIPFISFVYNTQGLSNNDPQNMALAMTCNIPAENQSGIYARFA